MKAVERTIQQLLHSGDRYVIPIFQRYYIWKKINWDQLWEDLQFLLETNDKQPHHFLGSLVCVPETHQPGTIPAYQVIDGQQRLATLSIILCSIRDTAKKVSWDNLAAEIHETYLIRV